MAKHSGNTVAVKIAKDKNFGQIIHLLQKINFILLISTATFLLVGIILVYSYNGGNNLGKFFIIVKNYPTAEGNRKVSINGMVAIFCFISILFHFLLTLTQKTLYIIEKNGKLSVTQWFLSAIYILLIVIVFSLVTVGLFPTYKIGGGDSSNLPNKCGFYQNPQEDGQTLSVLGYFVLVLSIAIVAIYFPHRKYCKLVYNDQLVKKNK